MKILLVTAGSRGDVEPFVALAERAQAAGHEVTLIAPDNSGVDAGAITVLSMGVDYTRLIEAQGVSVTRALAAYRTVIRPLMHEVIVTSARLALDVAPDVIIWHPKVLSAPIVADALGIPHVLVEIVPAMTPTTAFPAAGTIARGPGWLNRTTYRAASGAAAMFARDLAEVRQLAGVTSRHVSPPAATLMPVSPAILRRPRDWPDSIHLTGAWRRAVAPADALDSELHGFLDAGPVVYAGFGSMATGDAAARGRAIVDAVRTRGERVVVATGLGGIAVADALRGDDVLVRRSVPHDAVLPHATAAIHHGGIGTVQAATLAGAPSIIAPFIADQPFWAARLREAGLAGPPLRANRLTADAVGQALDAASSYRDAVASAAAAMRAEDGAGAALEVITQLGRAAPGY